MQSASFKEGEGDFLLVVSGLTHFSPFLAGWQEFKDHVRKVVKEQPGWTDTFPGREGEMQGWCKLKDSEDAEAAYSRFRTFYVSDCVTNPLFSELLQRIWNTGPRLPYLP